MAGGGAVVGWHRHGRRLATPAATGIRALAIRASPGTGPVQGAAAADSVRRDRTRGAGAPPVGTGRNRGQRSLAAGVRFLWLAEVTKPQARRRLGRVCWDTVP